MSKLISAVALLLMLASYVLCPIAAAAPTNKDYGTLPTINLGAISPSGNLFAYRKTDDKNDLFMVYSRTEKKVIAAAEIGELNPRKITFLSDDKIILFVSQLKGFLEHPDEFEVSTAFIFDIKNKEFKQLLKPGDNIRLLQQGLGRIVGVSADKKYIYMPAYVDAVANTNTPDHSLMRVDVDSPPAPKIRHKGNFKTRDYFVDNNGNILAKEIYSNDTNRQVIYVPNGDSWREIYTNVSRFGGVNFAGITPDLKSLVVLDENEDSKRVSYFTVSLIDGSVSEEKFGRSDADIDHVITDINQVVYGVAYSGFNPSYRFIDDTLNKKVNNIVNQFPDQSVHLASWSPTWEHILIYVEGSDSSGNYYVFSDNSAPIHLVAARPNIKLEDVHPVAVTKIKARDGLVIPTLLTIPNTRLETMKNLPAVLLPHGGPAAYDAIGFDWMAQAFANKGYLVIQPQFRGSTGFGLAHRRAGNGEWGKKMQDDLTDSLQFLISKGYVDASKVCIVGASYGGYAALAGGAFTPELYKCVVSISGVSDLTQMLRTEKRDHGKSSWVVSHWENSMANGEATNDFLDSISPVNFADKFSAPVLLIHGENDETVPIKQSKAMYKKLKSADKSVELKELKDENHYLLSNETRLEMLESMVSFVEKYLGK